MRDAGATRGSSGHPRLDEHLAALDLNLLVVMMAPLLLWWLMQWLRGVPTRNMSARASSRLVVVLGVAALSFTMARNSGVEPFSWLAANG